VTRLKSVPRSKTKGPPALREKDITLAIRDFLKVRGVWHYKAWGGPMSAPGIPDIIGCLPGGRFIGIEVKRPGGELSSHQARVLANITDAGGLAIVAWSVEDVIRALAGEVAR